MTIDITDRFYTDEWMPQGRDYHTIDREAEPFEWIHIHHTAVPNAPGVNATRAYEEERIMRVAEYHRGRHGRDGSGDVWTGPGYHMMVAQSGRRYAVGKAGTFRRHLGTGRVNRLGFAICMLGNFENTEPSPQMIESIKDGIAEVKSWERLTSPDVRVVAHRDATSSGFSTACPGRNLYAYMDEFKRVKAAQVIEAGGDMTPEQVREIVRDMMDNQELRDDRLREAMQSRVSEAYQAAREMEHSCDKAADRFAYAFDPEQVPGEET